MRSIERPNRSDRQADAVDRDRMARANVGKQAMRRPPVAHVVFRMHFEKVDAARTRNDAGRMLAFETRAGQSRMESRERRGVVPIDLVHGASRPKTRGR